MARFARQTERSGGAGRKRGGENECPPRPRLSRSEREAFCYWGFPPPNFVFHFAKCAAKEDVALALTHLCAGNDKELP